MSLTCRREAEPNLYFEIRRCSLVSTGFKMQILRYLVSTDWLWLCNHRPWNEKDFLNAHSLVHSPVSRSQNAPK